MPFVEKTNGPETSAGNPVPRYRADVRWHAPRPLGSFRSAWVKLMQVGGVDSSAIISLIAVSLSLAAVIAANRRHANNVAINNLNRRLAGHRALAEVEYVELPKELRLARNLVGEGAAEQGGRAGTGRASHKHDKGGR